jgi:predicted nucleotidyltransferase component of viral defense system
MIRKQDILDRAGEWQLRPEVVEKDYVLGWFLSSLGSHPTVAATWVFKGGTCLKKCYFETYRFSEDLDFTLLPSAPYALGGILATLQEIARSVSADSGIVVPVEAVRVDEKRDKQGRPTFKARVGYRGPLDFPGELRRILFDLTVHEPVLGVGVTAPIFHPYPDDFPSRAGIVAYSLEELLAEKTRALFERTRPRDLYDVVYVINNQGAGIDLERTRELFHGKCRAKGLVPPTKAELATHIRDTGELRSEWENMLGHQLPHLPPVDGMLADIEAVLQWIDGPPLVAAVVLAPASRDVSEHALAPAGIQYWGGGFGLEAIRFAGANRLLVRFVYHGRERTVEPYSLRRASTGNILLYAWERGFGIKSFITAKIGTVRPTETLFVPRYQIEFAAGRFDPILPSAVPARHVASSRSGSRTSSRRSRSGRVYVFKCSSCGKELRHTRNDPSLRKHTAPGGGNCSGRRGRLVRSD